MHGDGVTEQQWREIVDCFDGRCAYCLCKASDLQQEHVIAVALGGEHSPDNVVPACRVCNASKRNRTLLACLNERLAIGARMGRMFAEVA